MPLRLFTPRTPCACTLALAGPDATARSATLRPASKPVKVMRQTPVPVFSTATLPRPMAGSAVSAERRSVALAPPRMAAVVWPSKLSLKVEDDPAPTFSETCQTSLVPSPMSRLVLVSTKRESPASTRVSVPPPPATVSTPRPPLRMSSWSLPVSWSLPSPPINVTPPPNADAFMTLAPLPPVRKADSTLASVTLGIRPP